jgi:hypothetical protein
MSEFMFALEKVEIAEVGSTPNIDLGKTKGGATFRQTPTEVEIDNDQDLEPEEIITTKLRRELEINLADCKLANLQLAFGGEVVGSVLTLPSSVTTGIKKAVRLTTKEIGGVAFQIDLAKARIRPEAETVFGIDGNSTLRLFLVNLASETPPKITKLTT